MTIIITTIIVSFLLAFLLGFLLGFFKKIFAVEVDPKVTQVREVLPGANCGGCGFPGCDGFAAAVAAGKAPCNGCKAGGASVAEKVGNIMGVSVTAEKKVTLLACQGSKLHAVQRGNYTGIQSCQAAKLSVGSTKMCTFGCIGLGDCVNVCKFDALHMGENGIPEVDYSKCVGCGQCVDACPNHLYSLTAQNLKGAVALCSNRTTNNASVMKNCKVGCIKCKKCERSCPEHAIVVTDGIPKVDYSKCVSCGICVEGCPTHVLKLIQNIVTVTA
ncbi:MAG: RnfABCDGE type electron transport complex subunit B [Treponema sp.]|nr:RnfABCDGE type electron transport complex subunit B [Treponema sp.]